MPGSAASAVSRKTNFASNTGPAIAAVLKFWWVRKPGFIPKKMD
jgi:hypothetical protein